MHFIKHVICSEDLYMKNNSRKVRVSCLSTSEKKFETQLYEGHSSYITTKQNILISNFNQTSNPKNKFEKNVTI